MEALLKDFTWLDKLLEKLPKEPKRQKTFYDIARFPRRENVISNVLGFFLREEEEHGFKRLFFDALLQCLVKGKLITEQERTALYDCKYVVHREYKNIDLLIKNTENKWALIIEHKIDHWLNNPLDNYYKVIDSENKKLIVLSLQKLAIPNKFDNLPCINLIYSDFIAELEKQFHINNFGSGKHDYFLQDFLQHLKQLKKMTDSNTDQEKKLRILQLNIEKINELRDIRNRLREYTNQQLYDALYKIGFTPYYSSLDRGWTHFLCIDKFFEERGLIIPKSFRFFVQMDTLFESNILSLYFEAFGADTKYGDRLKKHIAHQITTNEQLSDSEGQKENDYYHLACYYDLVLDKTELLKEQFNRLIYDVFLKDDNTGLIQAYVAELEILKENDKINIKS